MDPPPHHHPHLRVDLDSLDLQQVPVLSIDQIRAIRANNDYVERPVALDPDTQSGFFYAHDERFTHHHHVYGGGGGGYPLSGTGYPQGGYPAYPPPYPLPRSQSGQQQQTHLVHLSRSSTVSSTMSRTSAASDQRLLAGMTPSRSSLASSTMVVRSQPKGELKPSSSSSHHHHLGKGLSEPIDDLGIGALGAHMFICERCGRCKCAECRSPRRLPSCWVCGQRCLCSAESAVEYGTCLCCVKALFYHCSAQDDEDDDGGASCADRPCACTPRRALARWGTMGVLALCLPCLCCYPPARLCLAGCQRVHDRATRPGCRCSNTNTVCRKISASSNPTTANTGHAPFRSKSLEKPV